MKITYKLNSKEVPTIVEKYKKELQVKEIDEEKICLATSSFNTDVNQILLKGIILSFGFFNLKKPVELGVKNDFPCIRVDFEIEGHSHYKPENSQSLEVEIKNGHYNFFYFPEADGTVYYPTGTRKSLNIMVTEAYLNKTFNKNLQKIAPSFYNALQSKAPYKMFESSKPIPSALLLVIDDIISCSYQKEIKQVYLESKIKEVFSFLFAEKHYGIKENKPYKIKKVDLIGVLKAEKILRQNMGKSLTIEDLAGLTGVNQHKLKRNFKAVYQKPIFTYLTDLRMERAKNMLLKEGCSVTEVTYAVGYKNPQHFTAAFKKKFNYLPSDLKKKGV